MLRDVIVLHSVIALIDLVINSYTHFLKKSGILSNFHIKLRKDWRQIFWYFLIFLSLPCSLYTPALLWLPHSHRAQPHHPPSWSTHTERRVLFNRLWHAGSLAGEYKEYWWRKILQSPVCRVLEDLRGLGWQRFWVFVPWEFVHFSQLWVSFDVTAVIQSLAGLSC